MTNGHLIIPESLMTFREHHMTLLRQVGIPQLPFFPQAGKSPDYLFSDGGCVLKLAHAVVCDHQVISMLGVHTRGQWRLC
ncbi:MAG: hypothetical protein DLM58_04265 [Pseudonocardiales bacterium]|nr:MAG: hypothetical protein DLM58_04265 [Pseudonocardiales bacterium]